MSVYANRPMMIALLCVCAIAVVGLSIVAIGLCDKPDADSAFWLVLFFAVVFAYRGYRYWGILKQLKRKLVPSA